MKHLALLLTILCVVGSVSGDDSKPPLIVLPINPITVEPVNPKPKPVDPTPTTTISTIKQDEIYVVESTTELIVITSPDGVVKYADSEGPIKVYGKFSDGTGELETRTYSSKYVYFFTASPQGGKTELILIPIGLTSVDDTVRQTLTVSGIGPNPPPVIDPTIDPIVDPDPPGPPTGLRVLMIYNEDANKQQLDVVNSTEILKWMTENCAKDPDGRAAWRRWDRTSIERTGVDGETEVWRKLWDKVKPLITQNNMVFVVTDTKVQFIPMTNVADTTAFLQRIKDGK